VQAVTRSVRVPENASDDAVFAQVVQKYGEPSIGPGKNQPRMVWTLDHGYGEAMVSDPTDAMKFRQGACHTSVKTLGLHARTLEGEPPTSALVTTRTARAEASGATVVHARVPILDVWGAKKTSASGGRRRSEWDAAKWRECGPAILAALDGSGARRSLIVGLYDLSEYAPVYARRAAAQPEPALDLGL
jgi:hypothetical protein